MHKKTSIFYIIYVMIAYNFERWQTEQIQYSGKFVSRGGKTSELLSHLGDDWVVETFDI